MANKTLYQTLTSRLEKIGVEIDGEVESSVYEIHRGKSLCIGVNFSSQDSSHFNLKYHARLPFDVSYFANEEKILNSGEGEVRTEVSMGLFEERLRFFGRPGLQSHPVSYDAKGNFLSIPKIWHERMGVQKKDLSENSQRIIDESEIGRIEVKVAPIQTVGFIVDLWKNFNPNLGRED